jgi:hypothetical protein
MDIISLLNTLKRMGARDFPYTYGEGKIPVTLQGYI